MKGPSNPYWLHTPDAIKKSSDWRRNHWKNEENHPRWRGNNVSYVALHKWVAKHLGKPSHCEICGTEENRRYEWANISGKKEKTTFGWKRMCVPCHRKYDDIGNKVWKTRRRNRDK